MAKKTGKKKKSGKKKKTAKKKSRTGKLSPKKEKRGLSADQIALPLDQAQIAPLAAQVGASGGTPLGAYREPLSGRPLLLATLPLKSVQPTPFQRDLSPTHTKKLAEKIELSGSFLDPLIVVRGADGGFWTPNGRHRLAAAKVLGLRQITAIISPDEDLSFHILALNTEKAHNLKDRSLEVIRMAQSIAAARPRARESDFSDQFEAAEYLTLGLIYQDNKRFGGGAYQSFLKKVDRFSTRTLTVSLRERAGNAARLADIDHRVKQIIEKLKDKGFQSPYLRNYVVARINPVRFHRLKSTDDTSPMTIKAALTRMAAAAKKFDVNSVKPGELALVAALSE